METNPAWVDAPYRVDFCFAVPRCPRKNWSRKRRLKWVRRETKRIIKSFRPPVVQDFNINNYAGEVRWPAQMAISTVEGCPVCDRGLTCLPHAADCNYANGN